MKIFLCEPLHPDALQLLKEHAQVISNPEKLCEIEGAINRNLQMDAAFLEKCPRLRAIAIHGTGTDGVDLLAAKKRGIQVMNVPGENAQSVAEMIAALTLTLSKKIHLADRALQKEETISCAPDFLQGIELHGKTLGLIGTGAIAKQSANIFKNGFGMRVLAWSPSFDNTRAAQWSVECADSLQDVLKQADIVNIGVSLSPQTVHLIDEKELALMNPHALLINTARGNIVNETALYNALNNKTIAGAACDVFAKEPPTRKNPLLSLPNFIATPHIAASTQEALRRVGMRTVQSLLDLLEERLVENIL